MAYLVCTPLCHEPVKYSRIEVDGDHVGIHTDQFYLSMSRDEWEDMVARVEAARAVLSQASPPQADGRAAVEQPELREEG